MRQLRRAIMFTGLLLAAAAFSECALFSVKIETAETQAADTIPPRRRMSLIFGGDIMQHVPQVNAARRDTVYDYTWCFRHLKPLFDSTDVVVANFETTVSANGRHSGFPLFASPPQLVAALKWCGIDALALANNHICDRGRRGIEATVRAIEGNGMLATGAWPDSASYRAANPLIITHDGIRIALLNYTDSTNGMPVPAGTVVNVMGPVFDTLPLFRDLELAKKAEPDHIFVLFHWGYEDNRKPNAHQLRLEEWCRSRGVDFIVGAHSHRVQPVKIYADSLGRTSGLTAWSLGNMVSNQRWRYADGGILLRIEIVHDPRAAAPEISAQYIPIWVNTPLRTGRRDYEVLTPTVADTLLKAGTAARGAYDIFMADTRAMLSATGGLEEFGKRARPDENHASAPVATPAR